MISEANQKAIEAAGLSFILGMKIPDVPTRRRMARGAPRRGHPRRARLHPALARRAVLDRRRTRLSTTATRPTGPGGRCAASTSRSPRRPRPSPGLAPVKRNRFIALDGAAKSVNRELEAKARTLAGLKGYVTNLAACPDGTPVTAEFVIGSYRRLLEIEKSFRMSKSDLQARPIYHHKRESIEAHLTIVFAALAVSRWIEAQTGWSIRKFVRTARRYRTIEIQAGPRTITAADPVPDDLRQALDAISQATRGAH